jgi:RING finger protein 113A
MFKKRVKPQTRAKEEEKDDEEEGETKIVRADDTVHKPKHAVEASTGKSEVRKDHTEVYAGKRESRKDDHGATRALDTETEATRDVRNMHERNQKIHEQIMSGELAEGMYRGLGGYKQHMEADKDKIHKSKFSGLMGPTRANISNVRISVRFDYWGTSGDGGICKDYKETGYCGYGDTCKFLHDRSDYKAGWQLDREWDEKQKAEKAKQMKMLKRAREGRDSESEAAEEESDDEVMPFACLECREKWEDCSSGPVVTQCGHYFCENCAFQTFESSPKCPACNEPTGGIFNSAEKDMEKLKKRQKKRQKTKDEEESDDG